MYHRVVTHDELGSIGAAVGRVMLGAALLAVAGACAESPARFPEPWEVRDQLGPLLTAPLCNGALSSLDLHAPPLGHHGKWPPADGRTWSSGFRLVRGDGPRPYAGEYGELRVHLSGRTRVRAGDALRLRVAFTSFAPEPVTVVQPSEGTAADLRAPLYQIYAREHATGRVYRLWLYAECGMYDERLSDAAFHEVAQGQRREMAGSDDFYDSLSEVSIEEPGSYSIWVVYAYCAGLDDRSDAIEIAARPNVLFGVHPSNLIEVIVENSDESEKAIPVIPN
jgi:hypothetical protein